MNHILPYEAINEAAALPEMPTFLKAAGAKPEHVQYGGPRMGNQPPNAWVVTVKSLFNKNETWRIDFFPEGTFSTTAGTQSGAFLRSGGKWKTDAASTFKFGSKEMKGVAMTFTSYMVLNPPA